MARTLRTLALALGFSALGATATLTAGALADSQDHGGYGHHGYGHHGYVDDDGETWGPGAGMAALADDLNLDDAQRDKLTALRDAMRELRRDMWEHRGQRMHELMELAADEDVDRDAIHARIEERAAEMTRSMHQMADLALDFRDSLSPEQRAAFREHIEERWSGRGMGYGWDGEGCRHGRGGW